jgi:long-chain acyl-CoA synthetase
MSKDNIIISKDFAQSLIADLVSSFRSNWDIEALSDLNSHTLTYAEVARAITRNHTIFRHACIKPGDKIALCGKNSVNWAITFLSALTYGAVSVPILPEFHPDSIHHLVEHSEAKLLFVDYAIRSTLNLERMKNLEGVVDIDSYALVQSRSRTLTAATRDVKPDIECTRDSFDSTYFHCHADDLAVINYTSGSTGQSKGVMLTYDNLWSNARFAVDNIPFLQPGDGMVSMLPMAHMFGMLVELIFPLLKGCHITMLGRVPSPKILLDAFAKVQPKLVVTVPLVIEKIVKTKIMPALDKKSIKMALMTPVLRGMVHRKVRAKMIAAFGGNLQELVIGGAALNPDVEKLLRQIRFPYTVGYGMTECAPLICYCRWDHQRHGSCGKIVDRMRARIVSNDPAHVPGVMWVKGSNVMKGYYKNPEATEAVFDNGWMNTGDICTIDHDGYVYIKGRDKSMILGPSGQNIYPEEIENKLNNLPLVSESVVVSRDNRIIALVYPDYDAAEKAQISKEKLDELMGYNVNALNRQLPAYSRVARIELVDQPFEKTPKHSIKRFLYK